MLNRFTRFYRWLTTPGPRVFRYYYQRNPFDGKNYFTVRAANQDEADAEARRIHGERVRKRESVMLEFYRAQA